MLTLVAINSSYVHRFFLAINTAEFDVDQGVDGKPIKTPLASPASGAVCPVNLMRKNCPAWPAWCWAFFFGGPIMLVLKSPQIEFLQKFVKGQGILGKHSFWKEATVP
jgi:hypothetical protein